VDIDAVIEEQIAYYRARAGEYDDWWERRAEYDISTEFSAAWGKDIVELHTWLANADLPSHVLELAAGTGNWTAQLLRCVDRVTAVDTSPEVLAINEAKNGTERVEYLIDDVFKWTPPQRYDAVFFSFWISHVPSARWEAFWDLVHRALTPGGTVLFCDNAHPEYAKQNGPADWPVADTLRTSARTEGAEQRQLRDGSTHTITKRYWSPQELGTDLAELGWEATVGNTSFAFIYGHGSGHVQ